MSNATGHIDPTLLFRYEEGQLDDAERSSVEAHVEICGVCRAELALAREAASRPVGATLGDRSGRLKESFQARLNGRLGASSSSSRAPRNRAPRRGPGWMSRGLLAASVAVIAFGVYQMQKSSSPTDLGQTLRSQPREDRLSVMVERTSLDEWQLRCTVDESLQDVAVVVVTADGQMALERFMTGDRFSFTRADLGKLAAAEDLFVQLVATDALGNPVRSRPQRLP